MKELIIKTNDPDGLKILLQNYIDFQYKLIGNDFFDEDIDIDIFMETLTYNDDNDISIELNKSKRPKKQKKCWFCKK
jgi:hypothetical protein